MKIIETIVEPNKIENGSKFRIKVKVIEYLVYSEIKELNVEELSKFKVDELKGEKY